MRNRMPTVEREIAVPAAAVWDVLTDLTAWPRWGPTVMGAQLDGPGPLRLGARGTIWTPVGVPVPFEITEFDAGRRWSWKVAGINATRHGVDPRDGGCLAWMSAPLWAPGYLPVLGIALQRIERMVRQPR
ncbi:SRPBCC family protein [Mycobacterium sp. NPDC048908]|uniref:SRPBCC family protein n=1 Tax=Mycobacterium sp. NPDC048908 TaxID=3364292 RepID=UPI003715A5AC